MCQHPAARPFTEPPQSYQSSSTENISDRGENHEDRRRHAHTGDDWIGKSFDQTKTHMESTKDKGDKSERKKGRRDREGRVQREEMRRVERKLRSGRFSRRTTLLDWTGLESHTLGWKMEWEDKIWGYKVKITLGSFKGSRAPLPLHFIV